MKAGTVVGIGIVVAVGAGVIYTAYQINQTISSISSNPVLKFFGL